MKRQELLLQRHTGRRKGRLHDGKNDALECAGAPTVSRSPAGVERSCASSSSDGQDREVLAWHAVAGAGISGSMVRDLMLKAVELRFGTIQAPHAVEWLSDNGSALPPERRSTSPLPSAWCRASLRCRTRNQTASLRPLGGDNGTAIPAGVCLMNGPGKVVRQVWRSFVISPEWPTSALLRNVWIRGAKRDPRRYRLVRQAAALFADPIRYQRRGASTGATPWHVHPSRHPPPHRSPRRHRTRPPTRTSGRCR